MKTLSPCFLSHPELHRGSGRAARAGGGSFRDRRYRLCRRRAQAPCDPLGYAQAADYTQGHIPGAVNIDDVGSVLRNENTEDYIALDKMEQLLGAAGIDPAKKSSYTARKPTPCRPGS